MLRILSILLFFILIFPQAAQAEKIDYGNIEVRVEGIRNGIGEVGVALFSNPKGYPTHLEHAYETEWVKSKAGRETINVIFEGIPFGEYAVSVVHDESGNRKVDRSTLGFPKEGVGFSNKQRVKLSAPKFRKSKFPFSNGENEKLVIQLDYRHA